MTRAWLLLGLLGFNSCSSESAPQQTRAPELTTFTLPNSDRSAGPFFGVAVDDFRTVVGVGDDVLVTLSDAGYGVLISPDDDIYGGRDVAVQNGLAVMATDRGFRMFDVSDPQNPSELGGAFAVGESTVVEFVGVDLFVCATSTELLAVDVSVPASPVVVGRTWIWPNARSIVPFKAGILVGVEGGVLRLDDFQSPYVFPTWLPVAGELAVHGSRAYTGAPGEVSVLDLSGEEPIPIGQAAFEASGATPLIVEDSLLMSEGDDIYLFDLTQPSQPAFSQRLEGSSTSDRAGAIFDAASSERDVWFATEGGLLHLQLE